MKNISDIKVISIDLFRTLAKADINYDFVWRTFLGEKYTDELGRLYWDRTSEILFENLEAAAACLEPFKTTREIFAETYSACFKEIGLLYDSNAAAETLIQAHRLEQFYADARPFLDSAVKHYHVCLSTDCDTRMLTGIERLFDFEKIFVSEQLRAYKAHPRFFNQVLDYYRLEPHNILHIGDSRMDILTPARLGLQTCWLNRSAQNWQYDTKPDFQVKSLLDVFPILNL